MTRLTVTFPLPVRRQDLAVPGMPWPEGLEEGCFMPVQAWVVCGEGVAASTVPAASAGAADEGEVDLGCLFQGLAGPLRVEAALLALPPEALAARDGRQYLPVRADAPAVLDAVTVCVAAWRQQGSPAAGNAVVTPLPR